MIAVIFEVYLNKERKQEYLDIAATLREELADIDGFISIERFASLSEEDKVLSLSFWRDEAAIEKWRNLEMHRQAQSKGREGIFIDYRIRVAEVCRDYSMLNRSQTPNDSANKHGYSLFSALLRLVTA